MALGGRDDQWNRNPMKIQPELLNYRVSKRTDKQQAIETVYLAPQEAAVINESRKLNRKTRKGHTAPQTPSSQSGCRTASTASSVLRVIFPQSSSQTHGVSDRCENLSVHLTDGPTDGKSVSRQFSDSN